jgi:peptide/nickel transport system ATP-binding protein
LEVKNLRTAFTTARGDIVAVNDVSFRLGRGEALGLVGESGCGKTTAALSIAKLLPKEGRIVDGGVWIDGVNIGELSDAEVRARRWTDVSIVFQGAMNSLNPIMNVGRQISEAITLHQGVTKAEADRRTASLFERVGISGARRRDYPHEFSGGMKQRVMIAMALACGPKIMIGDEPTTALDVMVQAQILELLSELRAEYGMGLILITHDLAILAETVDRIAVMYAGKIVETGSVEDIFQRTAHPYTEKLIRCFPVVGGDKDIPDGIPGAIPNMLAPPPGCPFHPRCDRALEVCRSEAPGNRDLGGGHVAACHLCATPGQLVCEIR